MKTSSADLEFSLRDLFDRQQRALQPSPREWGDEPAIAVVHLERPGRGRRRAAALLVPIAAVVAAVVAASVAVGGHSVVGTRHARPRADAGVHWSTPQVSLDAASFSIAVGGEQFTASVPEVSVHSDPGDSRYQTLELEWVEHGVPMRWYIYLRSDGTNWWSDEMRTYDASSAGDWVYFAGPFFRSPLGMPFVGNLDLEASDHGVTSHLVVTGLHLRAFRGVGPGASSTPSSGSSSSNATTRCQVGRVNPPSCGG